MLMAAVQEIVRRVLETHSQMSAATEYSGQIHLNQAVPVGKRSANASSSIPRERCWSVDAWWEARKMMDGLVNMRTGRKIPTNEVIILGQ